MDTTTIIIITIFILLILGAIVGYFIYKKYNLRQDIVTSISTLKYKINPSDTTNYHSARSNLLNIKEKRNSAIDKKLEKLDQLNVVNETKSDTFKLYKENKELYKEFKPLGDVLLKLKDVKNGIDGMVNLDNELIDIRLKLESMAEEYEPELGKFILAKNGYIMIDKKINNLKKTTMDYEKMEVLYNAHVYEILLKNIVDNYNNDISSDITDIDTQPNSVNTSLGSMDTSVDEIW